MHGRHQRLLDCELVVQNLKHLFALLFIESYETFVTGAKQFVVHDAFDTMFMSEVYFS